MFTTQDIVDLAIQIERNGERFCRDALNLNLSKELADLLRWMADEELQHIEWFKNLKQGLTGTIQDTQIEKQSREMLSSILGDQQFSLADLDFNSEKDVNALLARLIEFEEDTVLFYEMIKTVVSDESVLKFLDLIIKEEKQHSRKLKEMMRQDRFGLR